MKYKKMLKRKGGKDSDRASINEKSDQAGLSKKQMRIHVMSWQLSQEKINTQMLDYLTRGAHTHVPKREWFTTYKPYDGGSVLMENDNVCKTVGIGNIRMRMCDGQARTLTNVRHVPDLKKNLLSWELWKFEDASFLV